MKSKKQLIKKLSKKVKKQKEEILQEIIEKDNQNLREVLKNKLTWAIKQRQLGLNFIEETKIKILKFNGMIILINDVLNPKKKEEK